MRNTDQRLITTFVNVILDFLETADNSNMSQEDAEHFLDEMALRIAIFDASIAKAIWDIALIRVQFEPMTRMNMLNTFLEDRRG